MQLLGINFGVGGGGVGESLTVAQTSALDPLPHPRPPFIRPQRVCPGQNQPLWLSFLPPKSTLN